LSFLFGYNHLTTWTTLLCVGVLGVRTLKQPRRIRHVVTWVRSEAGLPIEEVIVPCNVDIPTVHGGFLFVAS
jgi:hypothetical protein